MAEDGVMPQKEKQEYTICIDLGNSKSKLIFIDHFPKTKDIDHSKLNDPEIKQKIIENIAYEIGWWEMGARKFGSIITEVEILFPHIAQYLELQKEVSSFFVKKGICVTFLSGAIISKNTEVSTIDQQLKEFYGNNLNNN